MKNLVNYINETLGRGLSMSYNEFVKAVQDLDDEQSDEYIKVLDGKEFNPTWLKLATQDDWVYGNDDANSGCMEWNNLFNKIGKKKGTKLTLKDVWNWLRATESWDQDDDFDRLIDFFPGFTK